MDMIGLNVERMQELINTPMDPPPSWARRWQIEAEHVLHLAHNAKNDNDLDTLTMLDGEAKRLVKEREARGK